MIHNLVAGFLCFPSLEDWTPSGFPVSTSCSPWYGTDDLPFRLIAFHQLMGFHDIPPIKHLLYKQLKSAISKFRKGVFCQLISQFALPQFVSKYAVILL